MKSIRSSDSNMSQIERSVQIFDSMLLLSNRVLLFRLLI